eukprot:1153110-Pelagomonas_calceolata.AAC.4
MQDCSGSMDTKEQDLFEHNFHFMSFHFESMSDFSVQVTLQSSRGYLLIVYPAPYLFPLPRPRFLLFFITATLSVLLSPCPLLQLETSSPLFFAAFFLAAAAAAAAHAALAACVAAQAGLACAGLP